MTRTRARFLIPSSERKLAGGSRLFSFSEAQGERATNRFPSLVEPREEVVTAFLHAVNGAGHGKEVLRLHGAALKEACSTNLKLRTAPTTPVIEREGGPLFQVLKSEPLKPKAKQRMRDDVLVVCPLFGLLGVRDMVPEYRCPIGAQIPEFGSVHAWWKERLPPLLERLCRGRRVFTFLPARLQALWDAPSSPKEVVGFAFERKGASGKIHPESAGSGRLSGEVLRHMLDNGIDDPRDLEGFETSEGHRFHSRQEEASGLQRLLWRR